MHSALVSPRARELVLGASTDDPQVAVWRRERNLSVLERECGSVRRLAAGIGAWACGVLGVGSMSLSVWHGVSGIVRVLALGAGVAALLLAALLGRRVWQAGRAVVDAYVWWELLPQRLPGGPPPSSGEALTAAVETRTFMLRGPRLLRTGLASLAFLAPFVLLLFATQDSPRFDALWPADQDAALLVAVIGAAVASWSAGVVVFGGQFRANLAHSQRDPVQNAIVAAVSRLARGSGRTPG